MRRFTFAILLSAVGGMLAIPSAAHAQRVRGFGMMNQAALSQAMAQQAMSPQIISSKGPFHWHPPANQTPGVPVPYGAHASSASPMATSDIISSKGPFHWHPPVSQAPGVPVPYGMTTSTSGGGDKLYSAYMSGFNATFSPYTFMNQRTSSSSGK
jgi:hypothetical protein